MKTLYIHLKNHYAIFHWGCFIIFSFSFSALVRTSFSVGDSGSINLSATVGTYRLLCCMLDSHLIQLFCKATKASGGRTQLKGWVIWKECLRAL